jgi:HEAT repeat protein
MVAGTGRPAPAEVMAALRAAAHDDNPRVAVEALYAFGALASEVKGTRRQELQAANSAYLAELAGSPRREMRVAAAAVIGRLYSRWPGESLEESVGPAMVTALDDADETVKIVAARGLGALRYEGALQPLTDLFNARVKGDVAEAALDALARIAHPSSLELFKSQLTSPEPGLRAIAVAGIGRSAVDRRTIMEVMDTIGFERSDDVLLSMDFAWIMVENTTIDPLGEALMTLNGHDIALAYLIEIASLRSAKFFAYALDPDPRLRADVANILGVTRDPRGLPLVQPMLKDKNPQVVQAAERAIARMQ